MLDIMDIKIMIPEEIYSYRIMQSEKKQYRECRDDKDHILALNEVFEAGLKLGYARGTWDNIVPRPNGTIRP